MCIELAKLLALFFAANGAPILARAIFRDYFARPIDAGRSLADGRRILGDAKTWRGLIAALLITCLLALALGFNWNIGMIISCGAMAGDILSSFIKRRLGMPASAQALMLDQIPESLIPAVLLMPLLSLNVAHVLILVVLFFVFEKIFSRLLYRIGIRQHPY